MPAAASSRYSDMAMQLGEFIFILLRWQAVRDRGRRGRFSLELCPGQRVLGSFRHLAFLV